MRLAGKRCVVEAGLLPGARVAHDEWMFCQSKAGCDVDDKSTLDLQLATDSPRVFVVDDDHSMRDALGDLLDSVGIAVRTFTSGVELLREQDLLAVDCPQRPNCLICDIRMPCGGGLELQDQLSRQGHKLSIIFMSAHGDVSMTAHAMKAGARDFLAKPFRDQEMLDAVQAAVTYDRIYHRNAISANELRQRYATLSDREARVLQYVTDGLMNKQIAYELSLSEITIKVIRGHVMQKMKARTFAELVKFHLRVKTG